HASPAQATTVAPTSLKNPGRTTPHSGASHSSARLPRAISNSTTAITPVGPDTCTTPSWSAAAERGQYLVVQVAVGADRAAAVGAGGAAQVGEGATGPLEGSGR